MKIYLALVLALFLSSCATGPSMQDMEMSIKDFYLESISEGDRIDVYIYYAHGDGKRMVFGDVTYHLDDSKEPIASLGFNEYIHIQTTPGKHKIRWYGQGKKIGSTHYESLELDLAKGTTYIFRQIHDVMFNRYSSDGLSVISALKQEKNMIKGKYYLSKTKKRN